MKRFLIMVLLTVYFIVPVWGTDLEEQIDLFGADQVEQALPQEAGELMGRRDITETGDLSEGVQKIFSGAIQKSGSAVKNALALCMQILAIVMLAGMLRGLAGGISEQAMLLSAVLSIGAVCIGRISGFFSLAAQTVDSMTAFSGFLYAALAATTAATGAVGTSSALYAVTVMVCSIMAKVVQILFLPGISCYMALMVSNSAVGDNSLKMAGDTLKQLITNGLKLCVIAFTAYISSTGVISGSADSAAIKAAKLTISTTVPVVGSMIADASETLLVSAGLLRSGIGIFGLLGVLAVSIVPFLQTGCQYLMLKFTAAAAGVVGEKQLSGLIEAMAGALGLLTAATGVCTLILMIGCVCFMRAAAI